MGELPFWERRGMVDLLLNPPCCYFYIYKMLSLLTPWSLDAFRLQPVTWEASELALEQSIVCNIQMFLIAIQKLEAVITIASFEIF